MKNLKKSLVPALILALCLALTVPAFAAGTDKVLPSPQALVFDGYGVESFGAYNINDYNYFKLRDIAALMYGTAGEFAVGWDAASGTVSITTGGSYVLVGGELEKGKDLSATAQPSAQTVLIDGKKVDTLSVYNIGGNNYFRLRDLGDALGFSVDYDADWNAAVVTSPKAEHPLLRTTTADVAGSVTVSFTYDADGRLAASAADDGSTNSAYTYNDYGVIVNTKSWGGAGENAWEMETVYNGRGAVLNDSTRTSYSVDTTAYTYNSRGVLTRMYGISSGDWGTMTNEKLYNDQGLLIQVTDTSAWAPEGTEEISVTDYTYDAQGRAVAYRTTGHGSYIGYDFDADAGEYVEVLDPFSYTVESSTVHEEGRSTETVRNVYTYADGNESVTDIVGVTIFDANGNVLSRKDTHVHDGETSVYEYRYTYNDAGDLLTEAEYYDGTEVADSVTVYTYDAAGRLLSERSDYASGGYVAQTNAYDENGNCVSYSFASMRYEYDWDTDSTSPVYEMRSETYTYDENDRPLLFIVDEDGEHYERTFLYDAFGNLVRENYSDAYGLLEYTEYVYG